jgi:two-component system sensor histidine kinase KdpD
MNSPKSTPEQRNLVIVCLNDHPKAIVLLQAARKRAQAMKGKWCVVLIETPDSAGHGKDASQTRLLRLFTLAEQMGGETLHLEAGSIEKGISQLLEKEKDRIALLIIGGVEEKGWLKKWRASPWDRVIRIAHRRHITVEITPLSGQHYRRSWREKLHWLRVDHIIYAFLTVGIAYFCARILQHVLSPALFRVNNQNVELLFMIACAFTAGRFGLLPGLIASAASFLTINYYFTTPYDVFSLLKLNNITDILNMVLFMSAAILISLFTSQTRGSAQKAEKRELSTQALFTLYRIAIHSSSRQEALEKLQLELTQMLKMDVAFFLPPAIHPEGIESAFPALPDLSNADVKALETCWKEMKTTGLASPYNPGTQWRFEPMIASGGEIGVLGVRQTTTARLDAWFGRLLSAIAEQTAAILEHIELERTMEASRISEEREKLRAMLLSSVSHDLKTPLASIIGALTIYRSQGKNLSPAKREMLIETAIEESERLDSFIKNILDMTRLETGKIEFRKEWHDIQSVFQHIARRLEHRIRKHKLIIHPYPDIIEINMDQMMMEQVAQNILDNACKYTPTDTLIEISYEVKDNKFCCNIRDHGPGLPPDNMERVFDKYARLQKKDSQVAGTGLGLAICKMVMEAQKASITAANHPDGGALFALTIPEWRERKNKEALSA